MTEPALILGRDLVVAADYGQIYIYTAALAWPEDESQSDETNPYLIALADATDSRRFVGAIPGLIDLMTPGQ